MNSMSRKSKILLIFFMFVSIALNGCSSEDVQYAFPLSSEDMEEVLLNEELLWTIKESNSFDEGHKGYMLENENHKLISMVSSYGFNNMRSLQLSFFTEDPKVHRSLSEPINEEDWTNMFKLAGNLYGNSRVYKKIYRDLSNYLAERDGKKYGGVRWSKRVDDIHISVLLIPSVYDHDKYDLRSIFMMNPEAYNEYYKDSKAWTYRMQKVKAEITENIKVADISSLNKSDDKYKGLIVKGHLENFKEVKYEELPSKTMNPDILFYAKDYISADLVDETGRKRVIVRVSSLERKELRQLRKHYITYYSDEDIYVVEYSVLDN